jgi:hypothetical protein
MVNSAVMFWHPLSVRSLRMSNGMDEGRNDDGSGRGGNRFGDRWHSNEDQISDWLNGKGGGLMLLILLGIGATLVWNSIFR